MREIYLARGICTNCGYKNYPQWGNYDRGLPITSYRCPNCDLKTWILDNISKPYDPDLGKTESSK